MVEPIIIKRVRIYNDAGLVHESGVVHINAQGECEFMTLDAFLPSQYKSSAFDAENKWTLMPGRIDTHQHGFGGFAWDDTSKKNHIENAAAALGKSGLSYVMPTLPSLNPKDQLIRALKALDLAVVRQHNNPISGATKIVGVHLEGPYIAADCKGAHNEQVLQTRIDYATIMQIISNAPNIKQWKITLAPNLDGAIQFLEDLQTHFAELQARGLSIKVNIGHCNANELQIKQAIDAGVVGFTHLGNACNGSSARKTKQQLQQEKGRDYFAIEDMTSHIESFVLRHANKIPPGVELICDQHHLSALYVEYVTDVLGPEKILLITDALGPAGLSDGVYMLGPTPIYKSGDVFYLAGSDPPKLAGSAATLATCAVHYLKMAHADKTHAKRMDALFAATILNPRRSSLDERTLQRLHKESRNNFVLVDETGALVLSSVHGMLSKDRDLSSFRT